MNASERLRSAGRVDLNKLLFALAAGGLAGAAAGAVARLSMRVIALMAGMQPDVTLEGTFFILVAFAILGALLALPYAGFAARIPLKEGWRAPAYGAALLVASAIPLLLAENLEGELALIGPWTILGTFAPVYLVYGGALGWIYNHPRLSERCASGRKLNLFWLLPFAAAAIFSLGSFATLNDWGLPYPRGVASLYQAAGISYNASRSLRTASVLLLGAAYLGGATWLFFSQSKSWMPRFAAVGLLSFAAGFFASRDIFLSTFGVGGFALWLGGLVRATGMASLLLLIYLFPDGRFRPGWTLPAAVVWSIATLLWLLPLDIAPKAPESALAGWLLLGLGSGLLAQWQRFRSLSRQKEARRQVAPVLSALTATWLLTAGVWAIALTSPMYKAVGSPRLPLTGLFAFAPYLLPWLLIPISLAFAQRYRGLWR